jgi:hypothetical protein
VVLVRDRDEVSAPSAPGDGLAMLERQLGRDALRSRSETRCLRLRPSDAMLGMSVAAAPPLDADVQLHSSE